MVLNFVALDEITGYTVVPEDLSLILGASLNACYIMTGKGRHCSQWCDLRLPAWCKDYKTCAMEHATGQYLITKLIYSMATKMLEQEHQSMRKR